MTLRELGMRHQAIAIVNLVLAGVYILYFLVSSLGAAFSEGELARSVDVVRNLTFVIFRYSLLVIPVMAGIAFLGLRRPRLSLMVMLLPVVVMLILVVGDQLMPGLMT